jgi:AcrR family transcriptional regulator
VDPIRLTPGSIVRAAAELVDADGAAAVNMSALARTLGVRTASLYGHVRDQRAVLDGVHELALDELADAIADATSGRAGRDAVHALAHALRTYATRHPGRWAVLQLPAAEVVRSSTAAGRLAGLNVAVFRGYDLVEDDVVHATRMLAAAVNGFLHLDASGSFDGREPGPATTWDRMLDALDLTFRTWATTTATTPEENR